MCCAFMAHAHAGDELERYVAQPDASYAFHILRNGRLGGAEYLEAILTSQTWRGIPRSEERRVGKECRSRWSPYH